MRASKKIEELDQQLRAERNRNAMLESRLRLQGCELPPELPEWAEGLTPVLVALMEALLRAYPRVLDQLALDDLLPKMDHALERDLKTIDVHVLRARRVLGKDVIVNVFGRGYRCSDAFHARYGKHSFLRI